MLMERVITKEVKLGWGLDSGINVSVYDGKNDTPDVHDVAIPIGDTQTISQVWWSPITPTYELQRFRWLDACAVPASRGHIRLLLLLHNSPPPTLQFNLFIRLYCLIELDL